MVIAKKKREKPPFHVTYLGLDNIPPGEVGGMEDEDRKKLLRSENPRKVVHEAGDKRHYTEIAGLFDSDGVSGEVMGLRMKCKPENFIGSLKVRGEAVHQLLRNPARYLTGSIEETAGSLMYDLAVERDADVQKEHGDVSPIIDEKGVSDGMRFVPVVSNLWSSAWGVCVGDDNNITGIYCLEKSRRPLMDEPANMELYKVDFMAQSRAGTLFSTLLTQIDHSIRERYGEGSGFHNMDEVNRKLVRKDLIESGGGNI
ncbi:MAG: hypothetical protein GF416_00510 [Candidatus Altiarchaeales archaeon]|nr:hypothetical protein [Candidatus Altiarchaeales archaeon]MBD3415600.1 hypothetical protein [Candidatus Altiarchaeales archaeon]